MVAVCLHPAPPMSDSADGGRLGRVLLSPWLLATAIALLLLGISLQTSRFGDEGIWAYSAWLWAVHADPPYVGSFENKPTAIFLLYRLCYELFGLSYLPARILSSAALVGTMFLLYSIGRSYHGKIAGAMAVLIFGLTMIHSVTDGQLRALTETFMILFTTGAAYLLSSLRENDSWQRRWWLLFGAGAALGTALSFKQTALFDVIGLVPLYLFAALRADASKRSVLQGMLAVFCGGCLVTALSIMPLLASDVTLRDYWNGAWGILLHQATNLPLGRQRRPLRRAMGEFPVHDRFLVCALFSRQKRRAPEGRRAIWQFAALARHGLCRRQCQRRVRPSDETSDGSSVPRCRHRDRRRSERWAVPDPNCGAGFTLRWSSSWCLTTTCLRELHIVCGPMHLR